MKYPLVEELEKRLLPEFEEIAERIRRKITNVGVTIDSSEIGSQTTYQGHSFCIDCLLMDIAVLTEVPDDLSDNVALDVSLGFLTTTPRLMAGVSWGEASFKDWYGVFPNEGMIVTDELLEELYQDLPRLYEALFEALRHRKPRDLC